MELLPVDGAAVHRWQRHELRRRAPPGLRRTRSDLRGRRAGPADGWWAGRRLLRRARGPAAVQRRVRRPDRVAPAARVRGAGHRALGSSPGAAHGRRPCRLPAVGRLAHRPRRRVQLHVRDHPHVLRGRDGTGDRSPGRRWAGRAVAAARARSRPVASSSARPSLAPRSWPGCSSGGRRASSRVSAPRSCWAASSSRPRSRCLAGSSRSRVALVPAVAAVALLLAAPAAYAVDTMRPRYSGGDPSAGPRSEGAGHGSGRTRQRRTGVRRSAGRIRGPPPGFSGSGRPPGSWRPRARTPPGAGRSIRRSSTTSSRTTARETWLVAVTSAGEAADLQLGTGIPVMATGGFSGGDDALTVDQLEAYVAQGQLRYIVLGGRAAAAPMVGGSSADRQPGSRTMGRVVTAVGTGRSTTSPGRGTRAERDLHDRPARSRPDPGCARC